MWKHGAGTSVDITSASEGGFTDLTVVQVRNDAGSLQFELAATTIAMLHDWLDEVARVELFYDGTRRGIYQVDDYSPKWSALTASVNCVGLLAAAKTATFTKDYASASAITVLRELAQAVPAWTYDAAKISCPAITADELTYKDKTVYDCLAELSRLAEFDYWIDADGYFNAAPTNHDLARTFTLGADTWEFDTTYNAKEIVNRLILATDKGTMTFDHAASQAAYGVRVSRVTVTGIVTSAVASAWADEGLRRVRLPDLPDAHRGGPRPDHEARHDRGHRGPRGRTDLPRHHQPGHLDQRRVPRRDHGRPPAACRGGPQDAGPDATARSDAGARLRRQAPAEEG